MYITLTKVTEERSTPTITTAKAVSQLAQPSFNITGQLCLQEDYCPFKTFCWVHKHNPNTSIQRKRIICKHEHFYSHVEETSVDFFFSPTVSAIIYLNVKIYKLMYRILCIILLLYITKV